MIGIYFSGTGNTKHCVETFVKQYDSSGVCVSIENRHAPAQIALQDTVVLGYPVYYSNIPKIMQDFIHRNKAVFRNKQVLIITTMGLWSGDGAGCAARRLRRQGATIIGGLHLKMPDCIGDEKVLIKTEAAKRALFAQADAKIALAVHKTKEGTPPRDGLSFHCRVAGLLGQRLWFSHKTAAYQQKPVVSRQKCVGCGLCVTLCPMQNMTLEGETAISHDRCTLCYRCFGHCPTQALTILGKRVYEQFLFEK